MNELLPIGKPMKKLVLYSDQIVPDAENVDRELAALLAKPNPSIGYIPCSSDPQRYYYQVCQGYYARLGMTLSTYFELDQAYEPERLEALLACDAIHLSGGNTYYFLYWLRLRGMLAPLRRYVSRGGVLIGVSAGSILMTPDITTSSFCGDEPLPGQTGYGALNLVDFEFIPHFGQIRADLAAFQAHSLARQRVVYACCDGGGIIVEGDQVKCIGDVTMIVNGEIA